MKLPLVGKGSEGGAVGTSSDKGPERKEGKEGKEGNNYCQCHQLKFHLHSDPATHTVLCMDLSWTTSIAMYLPKLTPFL